MIAGCPVLECLLLHHSIGFHCVRINSVTITSIGVEGGTEFGELIIENAPSLKRLLQRSTMGLHISVISAPKMETLVWFRDSFHPTILVFGSTVIQGLSVDNLASAVRTVKILAVVMHTLNLDTVIDLMKCFPGLEKLYIESTGPGGNNLWHRKHQRYYRGSRSHVEFATFFLLNANVLELMSLQVRPEDYNKEFFAQQCKMLRLDNKASGGARLHFTPNCQHHYVTSFCVHDLDLADPFISKDPISFSAFT